MRIASCVHEPDRHAMVTTLKNDIEKDEKKKTPIEDRNRCEGHICTEAHIKRIEGMTELMVKMYAEMKRYIGRDGFLYFRLFKAIHGCGQASKM